MDITIFLAQVWGLGMLALGLGFFFNKAEYVRLYRTLEQGMLSIVLFAMIGIAVGVAQVQAHNVWGTLPEIIISLLGWGLLLKAIVFAMFPRVVDKMGDWWANTKMIPIVGGVLVIMGAYLTWFGFMG